MVLSIIATPEYSVTAHNSTTSPLDKIHFGQNNVRKWRIATARSTSHIQQQFFAIILGDFTEMTVQSQTKTLIDGAFLTRNVAIAHRKADAETDSEPLLPNGGWDVHHHIFEPTRFEYAPDRHLTPPAATIQQFLQFKARLGLTNSVLTHGLSYGDDCSSLRAFVPELDRSKTFAVGVIDPSSITGEELKSMHEAGIRGIRVNLYKYKAMHDVELQKLALREHANILKKHCPGWSMAFTHIHPEFWEELTSVVGDIAGSGIPVVTDHFALLKGRSMLPEEYQADVAAQPGFKAIMSLVQSGALYVKISAPYRVSNLSPLYEDLRPIVEALVNANPKQLLWGSDWPHTPIMKVRSQEEALSETPFLDVNDEAWLRNLKKWLTKEQWDLIMLQNPEGLYGKAS
ncbi:4-sulfomuconolactone hydrolase [Paramyrothecium foliicola]|nr:4-sulfomuconolactone hydrolase [Paramyrothecium foliicola]